MSKAWLAIAVLAVFAAIGLSACRSGAARLEVLRSEPITRATIPDATVVSTTESPGNASLGVESPAKIRRTFETSSGGMADGIDVLAEQAEQAGWMLQPRARLGFDGEKDVDGTRLRIVISGIDQDNLVWVEVSTGG